MQREILSDLLSLLLVLTISAAYISWYRMEKRRPLYLGRAGVLLGTALVLEIIGLITRELGLNNSWLYNLFQLFEFGVMIHILAAAKRSFHKLLWLPLVVGVVGFVWSIVNQNGLHLLSSNAILIFCVVLTPLLAAELFMQAREGSTPLYQRGSFWFILGSFLYCAGLVPLIGGIRIIYASDPLFAATLWRVIPILAMLRYALYALAFQRHMNAQHN